MAEAGAIGIRTANAASAIISLFTTDPLLATPVPGAPLRSLTPVLGASEGLQAPDTACAVLPDDEVTPLEDCRPLEELDVLVDVEAEDVSSELDELTVAVVDEAGLPGMVRALTAPSTPTPPAAAKAVMKVRRLSSRSAASRARAPGSMAQSLALVP